MGGWRSLRDKLTAACFDSRVNVANVVKGAAVNLIRMIFHDKLVLFVGFLHQLLITKIYFFQCVLYIL